MESQIQLSSRADQPTLSPADQDGWSSSTAAFEVSYKGATMAVAMIGLLCSLISAGLLVYFKKERVFRAASRTYMRIIVWGSFLAWANILLTSFPPWGSVYICYGIYLTQYSAFSIVFGGLMVKTLRIVQFSKINSKSLPVLNDYILLRGLTVFVILWLVAVASPMAWQNDIYPARLIVQVDPSTMDEYITCEAESIKIIWDGMQFLSFLSGVFITLQCRGMTSAYNEGAYIAAALYNWIFTWVVSHIVKNIWKPTLSPGLHVLFDAFETFGCVSTVIVLLFFPKVIEIIKGDPVKLPQSESCGGSLRSSLTTTPRHMSFSTRKISVPGVAVTGTTTPALTRGGSSGGMPPSTRPFPDESVASSIKVPPTGVHPGSTR
ncbi:hypothetical protein BASA61_009040 [Batrachochytrium salamandrivorans]|nr:hypothetical protein BASA61_009040 [Batrachochytrium salamandrivorans]KAH9275598.1 hypothetical protein BASA83_001884 [Batrachochytrium salamandrivorans]